MLVSAVDAERAGLSGMSLGVGAVCAAASATRHIAAEKPRFVVLVGTAGTYPGGPPIGSLVVASDLGWADGGGVMGTGYTPRPPPVLPASKALSASLNATPARVLTTPSVTTSLALGQRFSDEEWRVEHLEAYAVAHVCADANIPFAAILGITNMTGPHAHEQWRANRDWVEQRLGNHLRHAALSNSGPLSLLFSTGV